MYDHVDIVVMHHRFEAPVSSPARRSVSVVCFLCPPASLPSSGPLVEPSHIRGAREDPEPLSLGA